MAEKKIMELPAGVFGEALLVVDIIAWLFLVLERKEQWGMLVELNKHLAFISGSLWFVPSMVAALLLILLAQEMRFKKLVNRPKGSIVSTELELSSIRSDWRWVKITAFVVCGTVILALIGIIAALRLYSPDDPVLAANIPVPPICKTADCFPPKPSLARPHPQTVINAPGGIPIVDNKGVVDHPTVNNNYAPPIRQLTEAQKLGIKGFLMTIPKDVLVTVGSVYGSGDADMYASEFLPLFDGRHYEHQSAAAIRTGFSSAFTDVFVATATENDSATPYRDAFVKALNELEIPARASKGSKVSPGNLEVVIGFRPEEVKPPS